MGLKFSIGKQVLFQWCHLKKRLEGHEGLSQLGV